MSLQIATTFFLLFSLLTHAFTQHLSITIRDIFHIEGTDLDRKNQSALAHADEVTNKISEVLNQHEALGYEYCNNLDSRCTKKADWNVRGYLKRKNYGWEMSAFVTRDLKDDWTHVIPSKLTFVFDNFGTEFNPDESKVFKKNVEEWLLPHIQLRMFFRSMEMYINNHRDAPESVHGVEQLYKELDRLTVYIEEKYPRNILEDYYKSQFTSTVNYFKNVLEKQIVELQKAYKAYTDQEYDDSLLAYQIDNREDFYKANQALYKRSGGKDGFAIDNMIDACKDLILLYRLIGDREKEIHVEGRLDALNTLRP